MTPQERKVMELALEGGGLYEITGRIEDIDKCIVHRSVIKEALAVDKESLTTEARHMPSNDALYKAWNLIGADLAGLKFEDFVRHLSAQQNAERVSNEQVEPVAWKLVPVKPTREIEDAIGNARNLKASEIWEDALTAVSAPPQRKPLTRGQIREIEVDVSLNPSFDYITPAEQLCRAIEAAHGIKE